MHNLERSSCGSVVKAVDSHLSLIVAERYVSQEMHFAKTVLLCLEKFSLLDWYI